MVNFKVDDLSEMNERLRAFAEFLRGESVTEDDVFASRIVSCELISNVIIHGGGAADFRGELLADAIKIEVRAAGFEGVDICPPLPDVLAENGRGMYIVRSICTLVEKTDTGIRVVIKRG